jgi:hypothetical protein
MSFLSLGQTTKKPLLPFSPNNDRAFIVSESTPPSSSLVSLSSSSMPKRKGGRTASTRKGKRGKATVRLVKGRLAIRVAGFPGFQRLAPSQLVRYIPLGKLKQAAKRVLGASGIRKRTIRRKKKSGTGRRRRRQGRRRR